MGGGEGGGVRDEVVLLVGAPRSGTYLLVTRLNAALPLAIPVETHFIPLFRRYLPLWGDLRVAGNRRLLLRCIYDFLEIWTARSGRDRDRENIWRCSLLATRPRFEAIVACSSGYAELVAAIYREYAEIHGARMAGDKSAFFASVQMEELADSLPRLKVIHLIRDGRDVSLSWRVTWFGPRTLVESAWLWRDHVRDKQRWGRAHPERYLELRYEDLLDAPEATLERIGGFLGLPLAASDEREDVMAGVLAQGDTHAMLARPLDPTNKEKWRQAMPEDDQALFEYLAGDVLCTNGYPVGERYLGLGQRLSFTMYELAARLGRLFSLRHWRLWLKGLLPVAVWVARRLGFSLAVLLNRGIHR